MDTTSILLVINSILLGLISILFLLIGYFLKDLHKDFKQMMERVHKMHGELHNHIGLFENLTKVFQRQIDSLTDRLKKIEQFIFLKRKD
ncbi:MAG TPA: hypothetical protein PLC65_12285, partial [Bacteroidia bacterium]|nr:hypothetical protein [Bacteroidia bacterium]